MVYGHGEDSRDAVVAAEKLQRMGYHDIRVLTAGKLGWHAAGLPLEGSEPVPDEPVGVATLAPGSYPVDVAASRIRWEGRNPNGSHDGTVGLSGGNLAVDEAGTIRGDFTMDLRTIRNDDLAGDPSQPALITHLESDDGVNQLVATTYHDDGHIRLTTYLTREIEAVFAIQGQIECDQFYRMSTQLLEHLTPGSCFENRV